MQPFQSYSCSEHVFLLSLFLDSSLNPIFSCFPSFVSLSSVSTWGPGEVGRCLDGDGLETSHQRGLDDLRYESVAWYSTVIFFEKTGGVDIYCS